MPESLYKNGITSEREYDGSKENYQKALGTYNKIKEQIAINGRAIPLPTELTQSERRSAAMSWKKKQPGCIYPQRQCRQPVYDRRYQ